MKSFDVFDTLIGRRFVNNDELLKRIEKVVCVENFVKHRKSADNGKRNIFEIYDFLVETNVLSKSTSNAALNLEYKLEVENSFPIAENIKKVEHGDLLISDMYFTAPMILEMVRFAGLNKQVTIYQSNSDKHTGKIWQKLNTKSFTHHGDNLHSDFENPKKYGIDAEFYHGTGFSKAENKLIDNNLKTLALLIREIRLRSDNKFSTPDFLSAASQFNLPSLIILSELICRKYPDKRITFLGRDCQLLYKLHSKFFKNTNSTYLPFSRKIAFEKPELAAEYLNTHSIPNSVLFDLNSTGTTWKYIKEFIKVEVGVGIYLNEQSYIKSINSSESILDNFSYIAKNNGIIKNVLYELLNSADHGSICNLEKIADNVLLSNYSEMDLPVDIITDLHSPVNLAIGLSDIYCEKIQSELFAISTDKLIEIFCYLVSSISMLNKSLSVHLEEVLKKERQHIKELNEILSTV